MSTIKPLVLKGRIKNNKLLSAIYRNGYTSVNDFCRRNNLGATAVGELVNLKAGCLKRKDGEWKELPLKVAKILKFIEEDLFEDKYYEFEDTSVSIEFEKEDKFRIENFTTDPLLLEENLNKKVLKEKISDVLDTLPPKEREVIILRYGLYGKEEHTLKEIGQHFQVTIERVRQIEAKALRRLRHPKRKKKLVEFAGGL